MPEIKPLGKLPAYGRMSEEYRSFVGQPMMADWMPDAAWAERERAFDAWRRGMRDLLADKIWPHYDRARGDWIGASKDQAVAATEAEIGLMISEFQRDDILHKKPLIQNPRTGTHLWHFRIEDDLSQPLGTTYSEYDLDASRQQAAFASAMIETVFEMKSNGIFWFKEQFLRPRAYHASMLLGLDNFRSRTARTALHGAFHSGHCVESLLGCSALAEVWKLSGGFPSETLKASGASEDALAQYAIDLGDRRVFAGVHYPTDNIGSWVIALNLVPHIFKDPSYVTGFMVKAIERSAVFRLITGFFGAHEPLKPALKLLEDQLDAAKSRIGRDLADANADSLADRSRSRQQQGEPSDRAPGAGWVQGPIEPPPPRPRQR